MRLKFPQRIIAATILFCFTLQNSVTVSGSPSAAPFFVSTKSVSHVTPESAVNTYGKELRSELRVDELERAAESGDGLRRRSGEEQKLPEKTALERIKEELEKARSISELQGGYANSLRARMNAFYEGADSETRRQFLEWAGTNISGQSFPDAQILEQLQRLQAEQTKADQPSHELPPASPDQAVEPVAAPAEDQPASENVEPKELAGEKPDSKQDVAPASKVSEDQPELQESDHTITDTAVVREPERPAEVFAVPETPRLLGELFYERGQKEFQNERRESWLFGVGHVFKDVQLQIQLSGSKIRIFTIKISALDPLIGDGRWGPDYPKVYKETKKQIHYYQDRQIKSILDILQIKGAKDLEEKLQDFFRDQYVILESEATPQGVKFNILGIVHQPVYQFNNFDPTTNEPIKFSTEADLPIFDPNIKPNAKFHAWTGEKLKDEHRIMNLVESAMLFGPLKDVTGEKREALLKLVKQFQEEDIKRRDTNFHQEHPSFREQIRSLPFTVQLELFDASNINQVRHGFQVQRLINRRRAQKIARILKANHVTVPDDLLSAPSSMINNGTIEGGKLLVEAASAFSEIPDYAQKLEAFRVRLNNTREWMNIFTERFKYVPPKEFFPIAKAMGLTAASTKRFLPHNPDKRQKKYNWASKLRKKDLKVTKDHNNQLWFVHGSKRYNFDIDGFLQFLKNNLNGVGEEKKEMYHFGYLMYMENPTSHTADAYRAQVETGRLQDIPEVPFSAVSSQEPSWVSKSTGFLKRLVWNDDPSEPYDPAGLMINPFLLSEIFVQTFGMDLFSSVFLATGFIGAGILIKNHMARINRRAELRTVSIGTGKTILETSRGKVEIRRKKKWDVATLASFPLGAHIIEPSQFSRSHMQADRLVELTVDGHVVGHFHWNETIGALDFFTAFASKPRAELRQVTRREFLKRTAVGITAAMSGRILPAQVASQPETKSATSQTVSNEIEKEPTTVQTNELVEFFKGPWVNFLITLGNGKPVDEASAELKKAAEKISPELSKMVSYLTQESDKLQAENVQKEIAEKWHDFNQKFLVKNGIFVRLEIVQMTDTKYHFYVSVVYKIEKIKSVTILKDQKIQILHSRRIQDVSFLRNFAGHSIYGEDVVNIDLQKVDEEVAKLQETIDPDLKKSYFDKIATTLVDDRLREVFQGKTKEELRELILNDLEHHELAHKIKEKQKIKYVLDDRFGISEIKWGNNLTPEAKESIENEVQAYLAHLALSKEPTLILAQLLNHLHSLEYTGDLFAYYHAARYILNTLAEFPHDEWVDVTNQDRLLKVFDKLQKDRELQKKAEALYKKAFPDLELPSRAELRHIDEKQALDNEVNAFKKLGVSSGSLSVDALRRIFQIAARSLRKKPFKIKKSHLIQHIRALNGRTLEELIKPFRDPNESWDDSLRKFKEKIGVQAESTFRAELRTKEIPMVQARLHLIAPGHQGSLGFRDSMRIIDLAVHIQTKWGIAISARRVFGTEKGDWISLLYPVNLISAHFTRDDLMELKAEGKGFASLRPGEVTKLLEIVKTLLETEYGQTDVDALKKQVEKLRSRAELRVLEPALRRYADVPWPEKSEIQFHHEAALEIAAYTPHGKTEASGSFMRLLTDEGAQNIYFVYSDPDSPISRVNLNGSRHPLDSTDPSSSNFVEYHAIRLLFNYLMSTLWEINPAIEWSKAQFEKGKALIPRHFRIVLDDTKDFLYLQINEKLYVRILKKSPHRVEILVGPTERDASQQVRWLSAWSPEIISHNPHNAEMLNAMIMAIQFQTILVYFFGDFFKKSGVDIPVDVDLLNQAIKTFLLRRAELRSQPPSKFVAENTAPPEARQIPSSDARSELRASVRRIEASTLSEPEAELIGKASNGDSIFVRVRDMGSIGGKPYIKLELLRIFTDDDSRILTLTSLDSPEKGRVKIDGKPFADISFEHSYAVIRSPSDVSPQTSRARRAELRNLYQNADIGFLEASVGKLPIYGTPATIEETRPLIERSSIGDLDAQNELIRGLMWVVLRATKTLIGRRGDLEQRFGIHAADLFAVGEEKIIVVIRGMLAHLSDQNYKDFMDDPTRFTAHLTTVVSNSMRTYIRDYTNSKRSGVLTSDLDISDGEGDEKRRNPLDGNADKFSGETVFGYSFLQDTPDRIVEATENVRVLSERVKLLHSDERTAMENYFGLNGKARLGAKGTMTHLNLTHDALGRLILASFMKLFDLTKPEAVEAYKRYNKLFGKERRRAELRKKDSRESIVLSHAEKPTTQDARLKTHGQNRAELRSRQWVRSDFLNDSNFVEFLLISPDSPLSPKQKIVLSEYFQLQGQIERRTFKDIGRLENVNVTRNQVRQILAAAIRKGERQFEASQRPESVYSANFSVRTRRTLQRLEIQTWEELSQKTESELLSVRNFGQASLAEIKEELAKRGLELSKPRAELRKNSDKSSVVSSKSGFSQQFETLELANATQPAVRSELRRTVQKMRELTSQVTDEMYRDVSRLIGIDSAASQHPAAGDMDKPVMLGILPELETELPDVVNQAVQAIAGRSEMRVVIFVGTERQADIAKALLPPEFKSKVETGAILITSRMNEPDILQGYKRAELRVLGLPGSDEDFAARLSKFLPHIDVVKRIASRTEMMSIIGRFAETLRSELRAKLITALSA